MYRCRLEKEILIMTDNTFDTLKDFFILYRRGLLQAVAADRKMLEQLEIFINNNAQTTTHYSTTAANTMPIQVTVTDSNGFAELVTTTANTKFVNSGSHYITIESDLEKSLKTYATIVQANANERQKAYMQIVRFIEKQYGLSPAKWDKE